MKFEEALALMREGKTVVAQNGNHWKIENAVFKYCLPPDSFNPGWHLTPYLRDCDVLGEWVVKEDPKFQYLWRDKGLGISDGVKIWEGTTGRCSSEEEALKTFRHPERIELRRIEP